MVHFTPEQVEYIGTESLVHIAPLDVAHYTLVCSLSLTFFAFTGAPTESLCLTMKKIMNRKISVSVYFLVLVMFVGSCITVLFGASVRHVLLGNYRLGTFGEALLRVAEFPSLAKEVMGIMKDGSYSMVIEDRFPSLNGFKKAGKVPSGALGDNGYIIFSSYDTVNKQSTVQLIRIADQHVIKEWTPDVDAILGQVQSNIQIHSVRLTHPMLLENGSLVLNIADGPLIKIGSSSAIEWLLDGTYHHSVELDAEGNIWACSVMHPSAYVGVLSYRDDAIAKISPAGKVLFKKSIAKILEENGYRWLLAVGFRGRPNEDPIHLNEVQPALADSKYWKKGDLMLSMRHLGTIALYRPSTEKIIWLKTGPWMNQHDVEFVSDHEISVFSNNVIDYFKGHVLMDGQNDVSLYDFNTNTVSSPYKKAMKSLAVRTLTEGRSKLLSNGDVFIEETNYGRLLRLTPETAKWEFVRRVDKNHLSMPSWSRYLTEEQVRQGFPNFQSSTQHL